MTSNRFTTLITSLILGAVAACAAAPASEPAKPAQVTISAEPGRVIPKTLFGTNIQWEKDGDGALEKKGFRYDLPAPLLERVRQAGISLIRYPGGSLSNTFNWKQAVGDHQQRKDNPSFGGSPERPNFGPAELLALNALTGSQALITVNPNLGVADAVDLVEYFNGGPDTPWGRKRAAAGFEQPARVTYWEIGNEIYSPNEPGHMDAGRYAAQVTEFARAMKAKDPSIKVGAAVDVSFTQAAWMANVYPHMVSWNEQVIKALGPEVDFLVLHYYAPFDKPWSEDRLRRLVLTGPLVFEQNVTRLADLTARYKRPDLEFALTEYNTYYGEKVKLDGRTAGPLAALFNAQMLMSAMREARIDVANHWSLLNNSVFGMLSSQGGKLDTRPSYQLFSALSELAGLRLYPVQVTSPTYAVEPMGNIPKLGAVPMLDAMAAGAGTGVRVAMVNRDLKTPLNVELVLPNAAGSAGVTFWQMVGDQLRQSRATTKVEGGKAKVTMPPMSFVLVTVQ